MGICSPYLIALPRFSSPVSRRCRTSSIYMEILTLAGAVCDQGGGSKNLICELRSHANKAALAATSSRGKKHVCLVV